MSVLSDFIMRLRGQMPTKKLVLRGLRVGENFNRMNTASIDEWHCNIIRIGNHVTMAGEATILSHDASTKNFLGYTKIAPVTIGDYVFIGEKSLIMPGVSIGNRVIIGAAAVVTHDVPDNSVVVGNPAHVICTVDEYLARQKARMEVLPVFDDSYCGVFSGPKVDALREAVQGGFIR